MFLNKITILAFMVMSFYNYASEKNQLDNYSRSKMSLSPREWQQLKFLNEQAQKRAQFIQSNSKQTTNPSTIDVKTLSINRCSLFIVSPSKL